MPSRKNNEQKGKPRATRLDGEIEAVIQMIVNDSMLAQGNISEVLRILITAWVQRIEGAGKNPVIEFEKEAAQVFNARRAQAEPEIRTPSRARGVGRALNSKAEKRARQKKDRTG